MPKIRRNFEVRIYLDTALAADVVNGSVVKVGSVIENSAKGSLLYPTGGSCCFYLTEQQDSRFLTSIEKTLLLKHLQGWQYCLLQLPFGT